MQIMEVAAGGRHVLALSGILICLCLKSFLFGFFISRIFQIWYLFRFISIIEYQVDCENM